MPAEAVHLSALADTLSDASIAVKRITDGPERLSATRLGAVMVDLPYFDEFALAVLNFLRKRAQKHSPWGDIFHHGTPISVGRRLGERAVALGRSAATKDTGAILQALALGYMCHAAVDTAMHPMVNRLARARQQTHGGAHSRQHQEVEKFQSILFHEQRFGFDFMGSLHLYRYISVEGSLLGRASLLQSAVREVLHAEHQHSPSAEELRRWVRGYRTYTLLLASPLGKTIAPRADKERERAPLFDDLAFPRLFAEAVAQSRRWVAAFTDYLVDGSFDDSARAALAKIIPEGTIDPDPDAASSAAAPSSAAS